MLVAEKVLVADEVARRAENAALGQLPVASGLPLSTPSPTLKPLGSNPAARSARLTAATSPTSRVPAQ